MVTTIQIENETAQLLKSYKERLHTKTYDELIRKLLRDRTEESMFGFLGKKDMKYVLKDLRDKNDRD